MRPPITYYGGKQKLAKELLQLIPAHKLYVEPFVGGGALFFAKEPSQAEIINDLNGNVTNFYSVAQSQFEELKKLIEGTLHSRATYKEALEVYHSPEKYDPIKRGIAFWVVTNQGFAGKIGSWALSRDGKIGKTLASKREKFTKEYAERLKHVQIENKDALDIIKQYDSPDTFFYLDPPYFNSDCGHYKGYNEEDYIKLLELLSTLKGKFLLSSYPSETLRERIDKYGWSIREKHQRVSVTRLTKKEKTEVMVFNYGESPQAITPASENKEPSLTVGVQNKNEKSKQVGVEKVGIEEEYSGKNPLHLMEKVRCFATPYKNGESMKEQMEGTAPLTKVQEGKLEYKGKHNTYYVLGEIPMDLSNLKVTLLVSEEDSDKRERCKLDLYEREEVKHNAEIIARSFLLKEEMVLTELNILTGLLESYRDKVAEKQNKSFHPERIQVPITGKNGALTTATRFLTEPDLMRRADELMEQAGIISSLRLMLLLGAISYKNSTPLHIAIHGNNRYTKSLIESISECIPPEDRVVLDNISGKSLYHCTNGELIHKALFLPFSLEKKAVGALSQLQQHGTLSTATTVKDRLGNMVTAMKQVKSHFSTIMCTSQGAEKSDMLVVNTEGTISTDKILDYENRKFSGDHDEKTERKAQEFFQNIIRSLKQLEVINPYTGDVVLPVNAQVIIRMNRLFQSLIKQVSLFHQYQRKRDHKGRIIAEKEDIQIAADMLFGSMAMENDELDSGLRKFFTDIKEYVKNRAGKKAKESWFTMRELRRELDVSRSSCFRFITELYRLEYIERTGYANKGLKYRIVHWNDVEKSREQIKEKIKEQLKVIGVPNKNTPSGTPEPATAKATTRGIPSAA